MATSFYFGPLAPPALSPEGWTLGDWGFPAGSCSYNRNGANIAIYRLGVPEPIFVGLVTDLTKSDGTPYADFAELITANAAFFLKAQGGSALGFTPENIANRGVADGYAPLNSLGLVPAVHLPSFVDDVLEYPNFASLPAVGEEGIIYITTDNSKSYRWGGTVYVELGAAEYWEEGLGNVYRTSGNVFAGKTTGTERLESAGNIAADGQLISRVAQGTPPLAVSSTTTVASLRSETSNKLINRGVTAIGFNGSSDLQITGLLGFIYGANFANAPSTSSGNVIRKERNWDLSTASAIGTFDLICEGSSAVNLWFRKLTAVNTWSSPVSFWHSGNLAIQSTLVDTDANDLMKVGAFGLGARLMLDANFADDLNNINIPVGIYAYSVTTLNAPTASNSGVVMILRTGRSGSGNILQAAYNSANNLPTRFFHRQYDAVAGVWSSWYETYSTGNSNLSTVDWAAKKVVASESVQVGNDATAASAANVGAIRYRVSGNNSYCEMVMQTGAATYAWTIIQQNTW